MLGLAPAASGDTNSEAHQFQLAGDVGICPDGEHNAQLPGAMDVDVLEVEAARHGVDLQCLLVFDCCLEDGLHIDGRLLPLSDEAACRVRNDVDVRGFQSPL